MASSTCGISGNPDLYGLGIRLGTSFQMISTLITYHFLPRRASNNTTANLIFVSAILVAFIRSIIVAHQFYLVEGFVLLQLILVFFIAFTSGAWFILVDILTAFLNGFLSGDDIRQLKLEDIGLRDAKWFTVFRIPSVFGRSYLCNGRFRKRYSDFLTLATACLNLWFWISGHGVLKHVEQECHTYVFVIAPIRYTPQIRALFISIAAVYLTYRACLFLKFVLRCYDYVKDSTSFFSILKDDFGVVDQTDTMSPEDFLAFTKADQYRGQRGRTLAVSRKVYRLLHTLLLSSTTVRIIYSVLAIELTLAWNEVHDIYEVSSTGQFIPLFIGLAGVVKAIISATAEHEILGRKSRASKLDIKPDHSTGTFRYRVSSSEQIIFEARQIHRRKSMSDTDQHNTLLVVRFRNGYDALAPVLPIPDDWEAFAPLAMLKKLKPVPKVKPDTGRFLYTHNGGGTHVFHDTLPLARRLSWDGAEKIHSHRDPHRARVKFQVPLQAREAAKQTEALRSRWIDSQTERLSRRVESPASVPFLAAQKARRQRWKASGCTHDNCSLQSIDWAADEDLSVLEWLPPDLNDGTLVYSGPLAHKQGRSDCNVGPSNRGYSVDGGRATYSSQSSPALSLLSRKASSSEISGYVGNPAMSYGIESHSHRNEAAPEDLHSGSNTGGSAGSRTVEKHSLQDWACRACVPCLNTVCLCGPCSQLVISTRRLTGWYQQRRYGKKAAATAHPEPTKKRIALYQCEQCDWYEDNIARSWMHIVPESHDRYPRFPPRPSRARAGLWRSIVDYPRHVARYGHRIFSPRYTVEALVWAVRKLSVLFGNDDPIALCIYRCQELDATLQRWEDEEAGMGHGYRINAREEADGSEEQHNSAPAKMSEGFRELLELLKSFRLITNISPGMRRY